MGGLDFGAIMELVNGIMGANRPKENGEEGTQFDTQKIMLVLLTFAGRQGLSWFLANRRQKNEAKMLARGIRPNTAAEKKGGKFAPGLVIIGGLGLAGYLLVMKPEEREALFKRIDGLVDGAVGFVNEFQGKPYSNNFERNAG